MRLATAAASIFRGSIHRQEQSVCVFFYVSLSRVDNQNFVCKLPKLKEKKNKGSNRLSSLLLQLVSAGLLFQLQPMSYFSWSRPTLP